MGADCPKFLVMKTQRNNSNHKDPIAITEGTTLNLVCMESTFNAGQLVKVVDNLQSPHGLCLSGTDGTVFVADGQNVKQIDLEAKSIRVTCHGFTQAFDVALVTNGNLGVTNVQGHKISILEQGQNNTYTVKSNLRTGNFSCADGLAAKAKHNFQNQQDWYHHQGQQNPTCCSSRRTEFRLAKWACAVHIYK